MENETYNILRADKCIFEFQSTGIRSLLKQVEFREIEYSYGAYNMSLGTVLEDGSVNFSDSTNNGDVVKVLSTAIYCAKIFANEFPERVIFFRGNTEQKNRVYNEILRRYYDDFSMNFNIFGMNIKEGRTFVQKFNKRKDYSGFYLSVKI